MNGLEDFLNKIKGRRSSSINSIEFDKCDIERENIVREVIEIYRTEEIPYQYKMEEDEEKEEDNKEDNKDKEEDDKNNY
jgi:hypothetical protein